MHATPFVTIGHIYMYTYAILPSLPYVVFASNIRYVRLAAGRRTQADDATDRAIGQWRRRLDCVVQQQGRHIEVEHFT